MCESDILLAFRGLEHGKDEVNALVFFSVFEGFRLRKWADIVDFKPGNVGYCVQVVNAYALRAVVHEMIRWKVGNPCSDYEILGEPCALLVRELDS